MKHAFKTTILFVLVFSSCTHALIEDSCVLDIHTKAYDTSEVMYYEPLNCTIVRTDTPLPSANVASPSHYCIEFYPDSERSFHQLVSDTTKYTSLIPFGYEVVPDYEINVIKTPVQYSVAPFDYSFDSCSHECQENCCISAAEDLVDPYKTIPVYAYWPINEGIPSYMQYKIVGLYDVGICKGRISELPVPRPVKVTAYDSVLGEYVPIRGASVRVRDASSAYIQWLETDGNGMFSIPSAAPSTATVILNLSSDDFYIGKDSLMVASYVTLGNVSDFPPSWNINNITTLYLPYAFRTQVYQAAWYYFNASNNLLDNVPKIDTGSQLRINCITEDHGAGVTHWHNNPLFIDLWDHWTGPYTASKVFSTTLHELGHATQYEAIESSQLYSSGWAWIESYASLFGWYNTMQYYASILSSSPGINTISGSGRQYWVYDPTKTESENPYTPFFIDLYDDYNQNSVNSSYVYDTISNVPISIINDIALNNSTLNGVYVSLLQYAGQYFTKNQLDTMASYYGNLITIQ